MPEHDSEGRRLPATVAAAPGLSVRVYRHDLPGDAGTLPCWSYVTDGLRRHGQDELVFTLRRRPAPVADFPRDPCDLFVQVQRLVIEGRRVRSWGFIVFGDHGLFGGRHNGIAYVPPIAIPSVDLPADVLHTLLLSPEEAHAVQQFGVPRWTAWLAKAHRTYPYPVWSDPERASVVPPGSFEATILAKVPLLYTRGVSHL